jgi:hypothetical protein
MIEGTVQTATIALVDFVNRFVQKINVWTVDVLIV